MPRAVHIMVGSSSTAMQVGPAFGNRFSAAFLQGLTGWLDQFGKPKAQPLPSQGAGSLPGVRQELFNQDAGLRSPATAAALTDSAAAPTFAREEQATASNSSSQSQAFQISPTKSESAHSAITPPANNADTSGANLQRPQAGPSANGFPPAAPSSDLNTHAATTADKSAPANGSSGTNCTAALVDQPASSVTGGLAAGNLHAAESNAGSPGPMQSSDGDLAGGAVSGHARPIHLHLWQAAVAASV